MKLSLCRAFVVLPSVLLPWTPVSADVIIDANREILAAIRALKVPPPVASRNLAILHTAIFDAVNGVDTRYQSYRVAPAAPGGSSVTAAAAGAAFRVLDSLYGSDPALMARFTTFHDAAMSAVPDSQGKVDGRMWGQAVADNILNWRATDMSGASVSYQPGSAPGDWQPTPAGFGAALLPHWPAVTPWTMGSNDQFRPSGPPALESKTYADEYAEVMALGRFVDPALRTAEQQANADTALFWADGAGTVTPPGHWNVIAQGVAATSLTDTLDRARLFAALNTTLADSSVVAWDAKYIYEFWRPVTAIRMGDSDGNNDTVGDPSWSPVLNTPPFPEYVSGHSTYSGAASRVLATLLGTDDISFEANSDIVPGESRSYGSFSEAASEAGFSRIYGGIHFQSANADGLAAGQNLAGYVTANFFLPIPEPGSTSLLMGTFGMALLRRRRR